MSEKGLLVKVVVVGGTGLVGSKLLHALIERGHDAVPATRSTGVDVLTGASVVVDVSDPPSHDDELLAAESDAGVTHHVALSVVGTDRLAPQSAYFRARLTQEKLVSGGPVPYTLVRATQFFESLKSTADDAADGDIVRLPSALIQPVASADVAEAVSVVTVGDPVNGIVEVGGPEQFRLDELIQTTFTARGDARRVVTDPAAPYRGIELAERTLLPAEGAHLGETHYADWLLMTAARG